MKLKFTKGDQVKLTSKGRLGWESEDWVTAEELEIGNTYKVEDSGYYTDSLGAVSGQWVVVSPSKHKMSINSDHFEISTPKEEVLNEIKNIVFDSYAKGVENGKLESEVRLLRIYNEAGANITANDLLDKFLERNK